MESSTPDDERHDTSRRHSSRIANATWRIACQLAERFGSWLSTHESEEHISAIQQIEGEVAFRRNDQGLWVATFDDSWSETDAMELLTKA